MAHGPFTSQIEQLGTRIVDGRDPSPDDLALLHELLAGYDTVSSPAVGRVSQELGIADVANQEHRHDLGVAARHGGSWLKSIRILPA